MTWAAFGKLALKALPYVGTAVGSAALGSAFGKSSAKGVLSSEEVPSYLQGLFASLGRENVLNRHFNSAEAEMNRQFQHNEAQIQRDWYENMSNSAYTRSVMDMQNAGINPILAYQQGGAASASTGVPTGSAAFYNAGGGDTLSSVLSSLADFLVAVKTSGKKMSISQVVNTGSSGKR